MMRVKRINLYILIIFSLIWGGYLHSQSNIFIFNEFTTSDTVDMGMCVVGDSLETYFNILNYSGRVLKIGGNDYTYLIGRAVDDLNNLDFLEFFGPRDLPREIDTNVNSLFSIKYIPFSPSPLFPVGKKIVKLWLGLFDPKVNDPPSSLQEIVKGREFTLIARKSSEELDVYENLLNFDSVWVPPVDTLYKTLIVQNNTKSKLAVDSILFFRSINAEIRFQKKPTPLVFDEYRSGDERHSFNISYYPVNLGRDTALLRFLYNSPSNPDSQKYVQTKIYGVGVTQKIKISKIENAEIVDGFIDFGAIPLDTTKEVKIFIENLGNLPFGVLKQEILNFYTNTPSAGFKLVDSLDEKKLLMPTELDSFTVLFTPTQRDTFLAKIKFTSDITRRKISGYPDSAKEIVFYIRGVGLAPKLTSEVDSIDFGNIIVSNEQGCPTILDTVVRISNAGNYVVRVQNAKIEPPYPQTPFKIFEENFEIPPYSNKSLRIVFDSIARKVGAYEATLVITSRFSKISDTLRIKLKANGVLPDPMEISIPSEINFKPSSLISIPILVDRTKITRVKEYADTILLNPRVLEFSNATLAATASARANVVDIRPSSSGLLSIKISTKWNEFFLSSDTLIILNFNTYLGNEIESRIEFLSPRFGDGICPRVLTPIVKSGFVRVDSLCGLAFKLFDGRGGFFSLGSPTPNPADNVLNFDFVVPFESRTRICLYDSHGNLLKYFVDELIAPGEYSVHFPLDNLPLGIYFIRMNSGIFQEVKHFVKVR